MIFPRINLPDFVQFKHCQGKSNFETIIQVIYADTVFKKKILSMFKGLGEGVNLSGNYAYI